MQVLEQSLSLQINFESQIIEGLWQCSIQKDTQDESLTLSCAQMDILDIYTDQGISVTPLQKPNLFQQVNCMGKTLPNTLEYYFQLLKKAQKQTQELEVKLSGPAKTFRLFIKYQLKSPVSGLKFLKFTRKNLNSFQTQLIDESYLVSDNLEKTAVSWIPQIAQKCQIANIKVVVDKKYMVICSGELQETQESEDALAFVYKIQQNVQWEKIGLVVGIFEYKKVDNFNIWMYYSPLLMRKAQRIPATFHQIEEVGKFCDNYLPNYFQNRYSLVCLPFVSMYSKNAVAQSYIQVGCIDEHMLLYEGQLKNHKQRRSLFKTINMSLLLHKIQIEDYESKWVLYGLNGFLSDQHITQNECEQKIAMSKDFDKLNKWVKNGVEVLPVHHPDCYLMETSPFYQLKSRLLIHMIASIANCKKSLSKQLIQKNQVLNTSSFIKLIQQAFGVKKMNYFKKQFIFSTGIPLLQISFNFSRRENNLQFYIEQTPLQKDFIQKQCQLRQNLELFHNNSIKEPLGIILKSNKQCVPEISKQKFLQRSLEYFFETNEIDYKDEVHMINLDQKRESKMAISCRSKFRKTINQKRYGDDNDSADNLSVSQNERKFTNPALWIKIDQENLFLKEVELKQSETLLLIQLTKENNSSIIYSILRQLEQQPTQMVVNTLCELIEQKEFDPIILRYMAKIMLKMTSSNTGWRGLDKLIQLLKKLLIDEEMVLSNDFSKKSEHYLALTIIKYSSKLKDSRMYYKHVLSDQNITLFLKLLQQNDNSMQYFTDSHYRAELIRALLNSNNPNFVKKILDNIFSQLQSEVALLSEFNIILRTILKNFAQFLQANGINKNNTQFTEILDNIKTQIKILVNKSEVEMYTLYFNYKLQMKDYFQEWNKAKILIWALKKIQPKRILIQENVIVFIEKFVLKYQNYFQEEFQMQESKLKSNQLAEILWDQLVSGISIVNNRYRESMIRIYRYIYYHFCPIGFEGNFFPVDTTWIYQQVQEKMEPGNKTLNIVNLRCLNLNKRKRNSMEKTKVNPRDMLMSYFKNSGKWIDNINWKSLSRAILQVLSQEKTTEQIEKGQQGEVIPSGENQEDNDGQILKLKVNTQLSMRQIKKRLQKEYYENMDQVEEEVYEVINNYRNKGFFNDLAYSEYQELVEAMFQEARQIVEDKMTGKMSNQGLKMPKIKMVIEGNQISFNNGERERQQKLMEKEKQEYLKKKTGQQSFKINLKMDNK